MGITEFLSFWPSLTLLALAALPASYMHVIDHGKLKMKFMSVYPYRYFGAKQNTRKYRNNDLDGSKTPKFWGSTTIFVMVTDFYHTCQAVTHLLMSLSLTLAIGAPWYFAGVIWSAYATVHAIGYKLLSR